MLAATCPRDEAALASHSKKDKPALRISMIDIDSITTVVVGTRMDLLVVSVETCGGVAGRVSSAMAPAAGQDRLHMASRHGILKWMSFSWWTHARLAA